MEDFLKNQKTSSESEKKQQEESEAEKLRKELEELKKSINDKKNYEFKSGEVGIFKFDK